MPVTLGRWMLFVAAALELVLIPLVLGHSGIIVILMALLVLAPIGMCAPRAALWFWWTFSAVIPIWFGTYVAGVEIWPGTAIGAGLAVGSMLAARTALRVTWYDVLVVVLSISVVILWYSFGGPKVFADDAILKWLIPYVLLRTLSSRLDGPNVERVILGLSAFVAAWAIVEYALDFHLFQHFSLVNRLETTKALWEPIQLRDGHGRSEAAFGHSIAMGCFIVMGVPFAVRSRRPWLWASLLAAGVATSMSRTAILAFLIASALGILARGAKGRIGFLVVGVAFAGTAFMTLSSSNALTQAEEAQSASYRLYVWNTGLPLAHWLRPAISIGDPAYASIDNAYLRVALEVGMAPSLLLAVLMAYTMYNALVRRDGPATAAAAAMGVAMLTVALITQWQTFVFAMLALAAHERERRIRAVPQSATTARESFHPGVRG